MKNMIKAAELLACFNVTVLKAAAIFKMFDDDQAFFNGFSSDKRVEELLGKKKYTEMLASASFDRIDKLLDTYAQKNIDIITLFDEDFPEELRASNEAYALFYRGNRELLKEKSFAILGTRRITGYGKRAATFFAERLSESGVVLIGSGSDGVEYTALSSATGGKVVLCFPNGLNRLTNLQLSLIKKSKDVLELSMLAPDSPQMGYNFMQNNKLIARLCCGMLLIEAQEESGSKYTVETGLEFGKEVFALPGDIFSSQSALPNKLIKELKAHSVTEAADIFERLNIKYKGVVGISSDGLADLSPEEKRIVESIRAGSNRFNDIVEFTGFQVRTIAALLPMMELSGYITKEGTGEYRMMI